MRKEGYCAFGAMRTAEAAQRFQAQMETLDPADLQAIEAARAQAHRLQTCLTLFRACYPATRVALWKRRLRRIVRALNALRDGLLLLQWAQSLQPPRPYAAGVARICLRLRQRQEQFWQTLTQAYGLWRRVHAPNEIVGLSRRWMESFHDEPCDAEYLQRQWTRFYREQASALAEDTTQSLEVRCGRLQAILEGAALLQPLGLPTPCMEPVAETLRKLEAQRFRSYATTTLQRLLERERERTREFAGNLRGFRRIERGIRWLLEHANCHRAEANTNRCFE